MFNRNLQANDELDRLAQILLRSAAQDEGEAAAAADSPFLFARVRARIADQERIADETSGWLPMLRIARRAVPAMASIALAAAMLTAWSFWKTTPAAFDDDVLLGSRDNGVEQVVLADRNNLSRDEIFNIVVERNYGRDAK